MSDKPEKPTGQWKEVAKSTHIAIDVEGNTSGVAPLYATE
tara:strand:+ start:177 stop:296 length:120 start_codon:yes stop_codon:yes gene_type:complete